MGNMNDTSFDENGVRTPVSSPIDMNDPDFDPSKDCPAARGACYSSDIINTGSNSVGVKIKEGER